MDHAELRLKNPTTVDVEEGRCYPLCQCGYSQKYPLCDGSHRDEETNERSLKYLASYDGKITFVNGEVVEG